MIQEGQVFNRGETKIHVLELLDFEGKKYAFMYLEDKNVMFKFYEIVDDGTGFNLTEVEDERILEYLTTNSKTMKEAMERAKEFENA